MNTTKQENITVIDKDTKSSLYSKKPIIEKCDTIDTDKYEIITEFHGLVIEKRLKEIIKTPNNV